MSIKVMGFVWECQSLSGSEKLTMLAMADWCDDQGGRLHPSIRGISKRIGASECQARRLVHRLIDLGYLECIGNMQGGNPGQSRQYKVVLSKLMNSSVSYTDEQPDTPSMGASPTPSIDDTPSADATPSIDAHLPLAPMRETPSMGASLTVSEPLVNRQVVVDGLDAEAWSRWEQYRREIKKPIKPPSMLAAKKAMARFGVMQAEVVEQSIANGYQGLFELKGSANGKNGSSRGSSVANTIRELTGQNRKDARTFDGDAIRLD